MDQFSAKKNLPEKTFLVVKNFVPNFCLWPYLGGGGDEGYRKLNVLLGGG